MSKTMSLLRKKYINKEVDKSNIKQLQLQLEKDNVCIVIRKYQFDWMNELSDEWYITKVYRNKQTMRLNNDILIKISSNIYKNNIPKYFHIF